MRRLGVLPSLRLTVGTMELLSLTACVLLAVILIAVVKNIHDAVQTDIRGGRVGTPFGLHDPNGTYTISERWGNYWLSYTGSGSVPKRYEVLVGRADVDLKVFIERRVSVDGAFEDYPSNTQCVAGKCHPIFRNPKNRAVVVDIEKVIEIDTNAESAVGRP